MNFLPENPARFEAAIRRFDEENSRDPNHELLDGTPQPRERVYAVWLTDWVLRLAPEASEALRLAARAQHLRRWEIRRDSFPMTRAGYLKWREHLRTFHAEEAARILLEVGYAVSMVERVRTLISKRTWPEDPEARVLEDALCLVFLERQFDALAARATEEKMIGAIQKVWKKMTPHAREVAGSLSFSALGKDLLGRALGAAPGSQESVQSPTNR
jgi:hypothetical protein